MGFYVVRKLFLLVVLMIPIIKFVSTLDTNIKELLPVKSEEKSKLAHEKISTNAVVTPECVDNPTVPPTRAPTAKPSISRPPTVKPSISPTGNVCFVFISCKIMETFC